MAAGKIDSQTVMIVSAISILLFIGILYGVGSYMGRPCSSIANCTACWNAFNETEKNNVYVDMISCACKKAKAVEFSDREINRGIQDRYALITGEVGTANEICDGTLPLIKYE